nr:putative nuclease HARBI1 [Setaria viridis]XP_034586700.1 putative nuclease HARBI1 [Setaria viridis]
MLTYGVAADATDDYIRIGESTAIESLRRFVSAVVEIFGDEYLRSPNEDDTARLLAIGESRGFPGMLGSIDCMHWRWKNCPSAWQGMYTGHVHEPTIILEAVADKDLWIWHAFFGMPGSHNDINVLHRSSLFARLAEGQAPKVNYTINNNEYTMGYYLADGIYPSWATIVKSIPEPQGSKKKYFATAQEACRKDVERAFGVLQSRFAIVRGAARFWDQDTIGQIMRACVIMHNMIVENERDEGDDLNYDGVGEKVNISHDETPELEEFIKNYRNIRDKDIHNQLQDDLIEHLWQHHPDLYK